MLLNIMQILAENKDDFPTWKSLILEEKSPEIHFLTLLAPLFAHAEVLLWQLCKDNTVLDSLLTKHTLTLTIKKDLTQAFLPLIARVCVYEMHAATTKNKLIGETSEQRFQYFIEALGKSETALAIMNKYPVLKALVQTVYEQYLINQKELLQRLATDFDEIKENFFPSNAHYQLHQINSGGDRHNHGRCVSILAFNGDNASVKIVYKPRSLAVDRAFQKFIDWINQKSPQLPLFIQKILCKQTYGWCAFVENELCQNEKEVNDFYQRMGVLLCISHLLGSIDIHAENIIAHGAQPVFIDLECTLRPILRDDNAIGENTCQHLVSETLLLPGKFMVRDDYNGLDLSGIAAMGEVEAPYRRMQWLNAGTSEMQLVREKATYRPEYKNLPKLKELAINPLDYAKAIMAGFTQCYHLILVNKSILLGKESPLHFFDSVQIRLLFRATGSYTKLLMESYHPLLLYDKAKMLDHFMWLKENSPSQSYYRVILDSEIEDLLINNVPYFTCFADGQTIYNADGKALSAAVSFSALDKVKHNLENNFDERDFKLQLALIENSFTALRLDQQGLPKDEFIATPSSPPVTGFQKEELSIKALAIAKQALDQLQQYKIVNEGKIIWPCVENVGIDAWSSGFTQVDLYKGIAGITLAFAYGASVFRNEPYEATARLGLNTLLAVLQQQQEKTLKNVGGFSGYGGIVYTLSVLHYLLPDERIQPCLQQIVRWIDLLIEQDNVFDLIAGSAGLLAGLLAAHTVLEAHLLLPLIQKTMRHIYTQYPDPKIFPKDYVPYSTQPLLGFSHGVAGIAWALANAHVLFTDKKAEAWIKAALAYERSYFNAAENNWPDFRTVNDRKQGRTTAYMNAWCHGASGIGLARLDMSTLWNDDLLQDEIKAAIAATLRDGFNAYDNLCHGNLDNLELLLQAAQHYASQDLQNKYALAATQIMTQIESEGIKLEIPGKFSMPGLMTGLAGVAYQMMRIADPESVSSLLLLKVPAPSQI